MPFKYTTKGFLWYTGVRVFMFVGASFFVFRCWFFLHTVTRYYETLLLPLLFVLVVFSTAHNFLDMKKRKLAAIENALDGVVYIAK